MNLKIDVKETMMAYENIIFERDGDVAVIKFNRPKALNAINQAVLSEVADALDKIEADKSVRVLVLTGEGEKAFVAGADIAHLTKLDPLQSRTFSREGQELFFRFEMLPIPVIASVNGFALGGGCEIAMACDFIYASSNAKFGLPEINLGLIPGFGGTQRLPRLVGKALAKEMCMTGGMISADEAKDIGLVNKVFPPEKLWEETMKTAGIMASKGKVSMRAAKRSVDRGVNLDLRSGCYYEAEAFMACASSPDMKEGTAAFLEKRKPEFKGELD
ncbi:MAG: enoyl-CoA hydratase-related protein [Thermodesulfobacteriota bacterium]|nr:enoyl-CoA hydratase-related protein [Thermodesulfobacteriota bacterium]